MSVSFDEFSDFVAHVVHYVGQPHVFMGIDPGAEGAMALICAGASAVVDVPTLKASRRGGKEKTVFNLPGIVALVDKLKPVRHALTCCLETAQIQVAGKASNNSYTAYRVGVAYGLWPLFLTARGIPLQEVAPITWKSKMGLRGKDKEDARHLALSLFPTAAITRKKDHNRAEALLLAEYLRRTYRGE